MDCKAASVPVSSDPWRFVVVIFHPLRQPFPVSLLSCVFTEPTPRENGSYLSFARLFSDALALLVIYPSQVDRLCLSFDCIY